MSNVAIEIENLGKQYRLGELQAYRTFRESLQNWAAAPFRKAKQVAQQATGGDSPGRSGAAETIWALKDVSFDVKEGEVLGIIGHNGAGKSTLLKILSRITEPTTGFARIHGRVSSLLEVGTGFHPELTGRENVFLNGSILGMSRAEIRRKFEEIVAFSGVEKFLDTPVKRYSSGMQVRLAFAVAAHLEPEILIIDEVLAVGDAEFQKRCLGKMQDVAGSGRTVFFVSHNLAAVENLCSRVIILKDGMVTFSGDASAAISGYIHAFGESKDSPTMSLHGTRFLRKIEIIADENRPSNYVSCGGDFSIRLHGETNLVLEDPSASIRFIDQHGNRVTTVLSPYHASPISRISGRFSYHTQFHNFRVAPGSYRTEVHFGDRGKTHDIVPGPIIHVVRTDANGTGRVPPSKAGVYVCQAHSTWWTEGNSDS